MTIKDLARETGYSIGTISRVLNNHPNVSEKARREVTAAIKRFGFERNENARILKQQHSEGLLVLVKGRKNELFASILEQLQQLLIPTSYSLLIEYFDESENEVLQAVRLCAERKPQGILFLGGNSRNFQADYHRITCPSVLVTDDASKLNFPTLSSVTTDDAAAADCAVSYLISCGHRRIGVIGGCFETSDTSRMRLEGCLAALRRNGIDCPIASESGLYSYEDGFACMEHMLHGGHEPTAIFAMSDVQAIGAIRALREAGKRVPEDISVCGFDGLLISRYFLPRLTTICQSGEELAERSVRLLTDMIEKHTPARHLTVPFHLTVGESVRKIL